MDFGKYDRFIRIETKTVTQDPDFGSDIETWATHLECWASVQDVTTGRQESTKTDLRLLTRPCKIETRYNSSITSDMRVILLDRDNRMLQIVTAPAELGRREAIEFMAEAYSA